MEQPDVRTDMLRMPGGVEGGAQASFFIGRSTLALGSASAMPRWQRMLFILLHRNASDPTDYFEIPANRVIELGTQYLL
jgi:KUP system potassium uptake protein